MTIRNTATESRRNVSLIGALIASGVLGFGISELHNQAFTEELIRGSRIQDVDNDGRPDLYINGRVYTLTDEGMTTLDRAYALKFEE